MSQDGHTAPVNFTWITDTIPVGIGKIVRNAIRVSISGHNISLIVQLASQVVEPDVDRRTTFFELVDARSVVVESGVSRHAAALVNQSTKISAVVRIIVVAQVSALIVRHNIRLIIAPTQYIDGPSGEAVI